MIKADYEEMNILNDFLAAKKISKKPRISAKKSGFLGESVVDL